ncbi:MAG: methylated-DNA--[protein]-cysteine S-methyltransferase [Marinicaulis sp.]|nr:methylated-DNA--[protein]-cysteine S-methyltransferase [Marinicaulis sp.]
MGAVYYTLFDTKLGRCGIAWGEDGINAVSFAEADDNLTIKRLRRRAPDASKAPPPAEFEIVINKIQALLSGDKISFDEAALDMSGIAEFDTDVLALTREIKAGDTKTYGDLARALGDVSLSRRVGQALGRNPFPIIVPCHRVLSADGMMTGFSAPGGVALKEKLLKIEGALAPTLFD